MHQMQLMCIPPSQARVHGAQAALGLRAAEALDAEAAEESRSGRELAALLAARLDAARRASEKLLGVLQVGLLSGRSSGLLSTWTGSMFMSHARRIAVWLAICNFWCAGLTVAQNSAAASEPVRGAWGAGAGGR